MEGIGAETVRPFGFTFWILAKQKRGNENEEGRD